jgi:hypothetical protein
MASIGLRGRNAAYGAYGACGASISRLKLGDGRTVENRRGALQPVADRRLRGWLAWHGLSRRPHFDVRNDLPSHWRATNHLALAAVSDRPRRRQCARRSLRRILSQHGDADRESQSESQRRRRERLCRAGSRSSGGAGCDDSHSRNHPARRPRRRMTTMETVLVAVPPRPKNDGDRNGTLEAHAIRSTAARRHRPYPFQASARGRSRCENWRR